MIDYQHKTKAQDYASQNIISIDDSVGYKKYSSPSFIQNRYIELIAKVPINIDRSPSDTSPFTAHVNASSFPGNVEPAAGNSSEARNWESRSKIFRKLARNT